MTMIMNATKFTTKYLKDYTLPNFFVEQAELVFELGEEFTVVKSKLLLRRAAQKTAMVAPLVLDGEQLVLRSIALDGKVLSVGDYQLTDQALIIPTVPADKFELLIEVVIQPQLNKALSGLYKSKENFCTQCEPYGFRRITYFIDRPDALTQLSVKIIADKLQYPVLLSNGNLQEFGELDGGKHWVKWVDPSYKPVYLFALVAGKFEYIEGKYITTITQREITLRVYAKPGYKEQCQYALQSLTQSMLWDEKNFGLEYELDIYMLVAIDDLNSGAMENKGLNIFNSKFILVSPQIATDNDYVNVGAVIAHEYFHNWRGDRVVCRDWFQLGWKEGFTLFCEQEFTADNYYGAWQRIQDAEEIMLDQFAEAAGPLAHPVRPDSYIEINNFYTVTVYNKGGEVVRMLRTLLGPDVFRRAVEEFFKRYDGKAVIVEDFIAVMQEVSKRDLQQFFLWYTQAATPILEVKSCYDAEAHTFTLHVQQSLGQQKTNGSFHIPLAVGLLDENGNDLPLQLVNEAELTGVATQKTRILEIKDTTATFTFVNIPSQPIPSLLRNFSAPVKLHYSYTNDELMFLMQHDSDTFGRWYAGRRLIVDLMLKLITDCQQGKELLCPEFLATALKNILRDKKLDSNYIAQMLELPDEEFIWDQMSIIDVEAVHKVRNFIQHQLAQGLRTDFQEAYSKNQVIGEYVVNAEAIGKRRLKNLSLSYLMSLKDPQITQMCLEQFEKANNMTDVLASLKLLADADFTDREKILESFFQKWQHEALVVAKWLAVNAMRMDVDALQRVQGLMQHPGFDVNNPSKVYSLIGAFVHFNHINFHRIDGEGYKFLADQVLAIDAHNPHIAARLLKTLTNWRMFDAKRQQLMREQLERIGKAPNISQDLYEIVEKAKA
jgi:aminopeptidase N